jgi:SSS family solute:Na+ symporter
MNISYILMAVAIYAALGTWMAYMSRKGMGAGITEYFLANRTVGGFVAALTYSATTYSTFMMMGLADFTYKGGVGALGFELTYLSGLVLAVFFAPRFWLAGKRYGYISPAELLGDRYQSRWVAVVTTLVCLIFLIPYAAVQLTGIGILLEGLSKGSIPFWVGLVLATLLAIIWAWIAGLRSVAWTDSLQALIMLVTSVLVLLFVIYRYFGGFGEFFVKLETDYPQWLTVPGPGFFNLKAYIGLTLPWFFFCISNPQVSQRLFIPKSMSAMRRMLTGFLIFGFIYTLVSVMWGFSTKVLSPGLTGADQATPTLLSQPLIPAILALIVMVGILGAAISTIDSILLTLSSMFARDLYRGFSRRASEEMQLRLGKWVIPVISVVAMVFGALRLDSIVKLSVAASAGLLMTVPAIFGAFFWKRGTAAGAIWSMIIGGVVTGFLQFSGIKPLGHWPAVWGGLVCLVSFIVISLVTKPPVEKAEEFIGYLEVGLREKNAL